MIMRFATFEFDTEQRELRHDGTVLSLQPKVYVVLNYLLAHRERAVPKGELLDACWPDEFVSEAALMRCIRSIRRTVGDNGVQQQVLKTLRGYGYRFVAEVSEISAAPSVTHAAIDPPSPAGTTSLDTPTPPMAERRQLTVLSCALVEGNALLTRLELDDLHLLMQAMHTICAQVSERFDGFLAQHTEQGTVIYFGYPQAHEVDALRAVRTGLALVAELPSSLRKAVSLPMARLAVRAGIDTGLVVTAPETASTQSSVPVIGRVPTLAAGLRNLAPPYTVVLSKATLALVRGYVDVKALPPCEPAGGGAPLPIYQVLRESGARTRLEVASRDGLTPFIGREAEQALLRERWRRVQEGMGQVLLLNGEAGIGKSRLARVFAEWVVDDPHTLLECRSSPHFQNTALYPIIELLNDHLHLHPDDPPDIMVEKLEQGLQPYQVAMEEAVPLLAALLSMTLPEARYPPLDVSPQWQRRRTLETIVDLLLQQAAQQPVLFILEDLHWTDPSTLELLELLLKQTPTVALCVLLTCRPDIELPWRSRSYLTQMTLNRLPRDQIAQMVEQVAGETQLPAGMLKQIVEKTDGVPLFVEEMTKAVIESEAFEEKGPYKAARSSSSFALPATLQDSLMSRLDRLGTAKTIAQYGAVLGRQFSYELLRTVSQAEDKTLQDELQRLVETELLYQRGSPPEATYTFKHALVQDTAYQSLLKRAQQQYHQKIARALQECFSAVRDTQPELVAHHLTEAGRYQEAIGYWYKAGKRAIERPAHIEAVSHLTQGLALLAKLPETPARNERELRLLTTVGPALMATKGTANSEVKRTYERALALCRQVADSPHLTFVLSGLRAIYTMRGEQHTARQIGEQMLHLAAQRRDTTALVRAHRYMGHTLGYLGELGTAQRHFEQGMALYELHPYPLNATADRGVDGLCWWARALGMMGYTDQALQRIQEAIALVRTLSQPLNLAQALSVSAAIHYYRREPHAVKEAADATIASGTEHGFAHYISTGLFWQGWVLSVQSGEQGLPLLQQGLDAYQVVGSQQVELPLHLAAMAEAYAHMGKIEAGLKALTEALAFVENTRVCAHQAELHRLKGELLLRQSPDNQTEAEACFQQALDVARSQQAKSWELRAAVSLARLWQSQDRHRDAYNLLAPIYEWFTEGFDTADLQEAKELSAALLR